MWFNKQNCFRHIQTSINEYKPNQPIFVMQKRSVFIDHAIIVVKIWFDAIKTVINICYIHWIQRSSHRGECKRFLSASFFNTTDNYIAFTPQSAFLLSYKQIKHAENQWSTWKHINTWLVTCFVFALILLISVQHFSSLRCLQYLPNNSLSQEISSIHSIVNSTSSFKAPIITYKIANLQITKKSLILKITVFYNILSFKCKWKIKQYFIR